MTHLEPEVIKVHDYSDNVVREWLKANNITEYILEDEDVYVVDGVITARCFTTDSEKDIPGEFPYLEIGAYDLYDYHIGRWELVEKIEDTAARVGECATPSESQMGLVEFSDYLARLNEKGLTEKDIEGFRKMYGEFDG